ncbi:MAG: hypothetical protein AAGJ94_06670 [Pseudomonadota bacterium]
MSFAKLCAPDIHPQNEFTHPNIWMREEYTDFSRLVIGSRAGEVPLILDLCREMTGPFVILYVLLTSQTGRPPARYQSPKALTYDELELFLYTYQEFLEQDGRHNAWIASINGEGQFILDQHNVIFAYGNLPVYENTLRQKGYSVADIKTPAPHRHNFHYQFSDMEDALMNHWGWKQYPLEPSDSV